MDGITTEVYFASGYHRSIVIPKLFYQRIPPSSVSLLILYVDDQGSASTRDEEGRAMLQRLRVNQTTAGFVMNDSPLLDNAPDGIDYTSYCIKRVNCPVYGPAVHITQPAIISTMTSTLAASALYSCIILLVYCVIDSLHIFIVRRNDRLGDVCCRFLSLFSPVVHNL